MEATISIDGNDFDAQEYADNADSSDFELDGYRFISKDVIDNIMQDELACDEYVLGCFNTSFLAEITGIDSEVFDAMQKSGSYEAIGKLIISGDYLAELQADYAGADGYGHHFAHYDGEEHEHANFYVFRVN